MALTNGVNIGLLVDGEEGEAHYEALMRQWRGLDILIQCNVISITGTPPGSPINGAAYIVAAVGATGAFGGQAGKIARYSTALTPAAWEFYTPKAGWRAHVVSEGIDYSYIGGAWVAPSTATARVQSIVIACSDEVTALTTGISKVTFRMPYGFTLQAVRASVSTAPTGAVLQVDVNAGGSSILSTKLTIDVSEKTSVTAAAPPVISTAFLANDAEITIDIDQVGSTVAGAGLKVTLIGEVT